MKSGLIKKIVFWIVILGGVAALVAVSMAPQPVAVDLQAVSRGSLQVTLDHEGKTRVRDLYVVSAPLNGRVRRIDLEPGDAVLANRTVLVTFEPQEPEFLDTRTKAEAEARVRAAEAVIARIEAERQRAKAEFDFAGTELARERQLVEAGIVAKSRLDAAETKVRAAREVLAAAESAKQAAEHELEAARARLVEPDSPAAGGQNGKVIQLRSPVSGVVMRRLRESEAVVPQGEPLLEVADASKLEIIADFLSTDAVQMRPGMPVLIERWGGEKPLKGRVRRIEPSGFMKISALGVEEQRVNVIVDFDDPSQAWMALGDEYRVEVRVIVWEGEDLLLVPTSSLFRNGDGWAVFVEEAGMAALRPVEVGHQNGVQAEILEGLREDERIVVYPSDSVTDGVLLEERTTETS